MAERPASVANEVELLAKALAEAQEEIQRLCQERDTVGEVVMEKALPDEEESISQESDENAEAATMKWNCWRKL